MEDQTVSNRFITRTPPAFDTPDLERRPPVGTPGAVGCSSGRILGRPAGSCDGSDPEHADRLWANPMGISLGRMRVSDLVLVDHEGNLLEGDRLAVDPVGVLLHAAVHRARPDVIGVCHAHSTYGSAWSAFGRPVDPITQDTAVFFEQQAIITEPRVAFDAAQADRFAAGFGDRKVAIQTGHGIFTTGQTIDEAAWWFMSMDRACQVQLLAEAAGSPQRWPDEMARGLSAGLGSAEFGWLSFQTVWDRSPKRTRTCSTDPDPDPGGRDRTTWSRVGGSRVGGSRVSGAPARRWPTRPRSGARPGCEPPDVDQQELLADRHSVPEPTSPLT